MVINRHKKRNGKSLYTAFTQIEKGANVNLKKKINNIKPITRRVYIEKAVTS